LPIELDRATAAAPSCALIKVMFIAGVEGALRLARQWQVDVLVADKRGHWETTGV
jgi:thiamine biosynthesis lipoprotein